MEIFENIQAHLQLGSTWINGNFIQLYSHLKKSCPLTEFYFTLLSFILLLHCCLVLLDIVLSGISFDFITIGPVSGRDILVNKSTFSPQSLSVRNSKMRKVSQFLMLFILLLLTHQLQGQNVLLLPNKSKPMKGPIVRK